jgi:CubicO group peptidase (beta-lactamase class C family)
MPAATRCLVALCCIGAAPLHVKAQSVPAYAGEPALSGYEAATEHARLIMREITHRTGVPGMSVAVGVNGEVVWAEGFGFADLENRVSVTPATRFRVGSVSKPITAAAVGLLVQQGKLDLGAPVQRYVPSFPEKRWPITTRQLAGHIAGVRHYVNEEFLSSTRYETVLAGLAIFQDDTLLFEPGSRYSYSSYAWNLISAVVEAASGQEFLPYMQQHVFDEIGMRETVADHTDSIIPNRTRFYERNRDGTTLNAAYVDNSYKWAGGGFVSTPRDLVRFGMAHLHEGLLDPATLDMMWTSQRTNDGEETGYGIGWSVGTGYTGRRAISHSGGSVGGTAHLVLFPDEEVVVAMLANSSAPVGFSSTWTVAEPFLQPDVAQGPPADQPGPAGMFACKVETDQDEPETTMLHLMKGPDGYWGRMISDDTQAAIIHAWSRGNDLRVVMLEDNYWVSNLWLTVDSRGAVGKWDRREITCDAGMH